LVWFSFPFRLLQALRSASNLLKKIKPAAVVSMGGFTAWPIVSLAVARGIPCFTHQLDLEPGLTNRLIARHCQSVTTSFEYELGPFGDRVADTQLATPVRYELKDLPSRAQAIHHFGLDPARPVIFIHGGGQGSSALNKCLERTLKDWLSWTQIIHLTGVGKAHGMKKLKGYVVHELFQASDMLSAHAAADLEICRGGIGTLSEAAGFK
jgi:UDP-N-acetylglucosamine--N-acetylmuramyl-(pentapeptide) pyrophosphoryl-undecaprenol N-acetylglucosamine transferase